MTFVSCDWFLGNVDPTRDSRWYDCIKGATFFWLPSCCRTESMKRWTHVCWSSLLVSMGYSFIRYGPALYCQLVVNVLSNHTIWTWEVKTITKLSGFCLKTYVLCEWICGIWGAYWKPVSVTGWTVEESLGCLGVSESLRLLVMDWIINKMYWVLKGNYQPHKFCNL